MTRICSYIPRWPLVVIVVCLFLLSLAAPLNWRERGAIVSQNTPDAVNAPQSAHVAEKARPSSETLPNPHNTNDSSDRTSTPVAAGSPQIRSVVKRSAPKPTSAAPTTPSEIVANLQAIEDFAVPRQVAEVRPPIAERIILDPSIAETPPLPVPYEAPLTNKVHEAQTDAEQQEQEAREKVTADARRDLLRRTEMPFPSTFWPYPIVLGESLKRFDDSDVTVQTWAGYVLEELEHLKRIGSFADVEVGATLEKLRKLSTYPQQLAPKVTDAKIRSHMLHTAYAMTRRLELWEQIYKLASHAAPPQTPLLEPQGLHRLLTAADVRLQEVGNVGAWRTYLLLNEARALTAAKDGVVDAAELRTLARRILTRLDAPSLSARQFDFFRAEPFPSLDHELRRWANEPVDYRNLLVDLERYETSQGTVDAAQLTSYYQILRWSPDAQVVALADRLNMHYRNANVRVAISAELLNHMLPDDNTMEEDVNDVIVGAQVTGRTFAATRLGVVLFPDRRQWRLGLFANGEAVSDTESYKSGALFRNEGWANFQARKMVMVDRRGVRTGQAEADANVQSNLKDFETDFDGIPLLNMLARSIARNQYEEKSWQAQDEMRNKVAWRAGSRFDQEVQAKLTQAEKAFQEKVLQPLQKLELQPTAVDMETTEERLIVRERLAGKKQLGAHTPRPQAPGHSWLSVQVHESAMNNALANLGFDGKRTDLRRLFREIMDRFDRHNTPVPEDLPDDVTIQFANEESVRVHCEDGRITLTIRIVELSQGRSNVWKNFVVRAHYKPLADQSVANLARDGVIELVGERLGFGDQVKLRGVFSKILSRNANIAVVNKKLAENPRLAHLIVNQFVVEDGWVGVAVEPGAKTASQPGARKKK